MSLRPRTLTLTTAAVGLTLTALVTVSETVPLALKSLAAHVALDTAESLIALLAAYLIFGRREVVEGIDGLDPESVVLDGGHLVVDLDRGKVERILDNLIRNAKRHTGEGSHVGVNWWSENDGVVITVEDDGPGVPVSLRESIFTPFTRGTDVAVPGSGVGLAVVATFAKLHGGRAWVEDRPEGGASFRVLLPETADEPSGPSA